MTQIIDGKEISKKILFELKVEVEKIKEKYEYKPGLAVIVVGNDPASQVYVRRKKDTCEKIGFYSEAYHLEESTSEKELLRLIDELNLEPSIHGILVQLPLPKHINEKNVLEAISHKKDVDGFHPINQAKLFSGGAKIEPCTPKGVMELLKRYEIEISGKNAVILGRSNIVGKPMSMMLLKENATVTICHSKTKDIESHIKNADILVAAIGKPHFVKDIKEGAVVIDVGINRLENGKLVGDVDYNGVFEKASFITPVPGGVGPMTIAILMQNTLEAFKEQRNIEM